ncbi:plasmid mobilization protein [Lusitaniella coriacea]|uniref:plasmid mobilization protein n=1 Tax=Lusitaniella coriacea TaxID=1983105 RepID=UPI003CF9393D
MSTTPRTGRRAKVEIRLTPQEKAVWEQLAKERGLGLSEFVRNCVERRHQPSVVPSVNVECYKTLGDLSTALTCLICYSPATNDLENADYSELLSLCQQLLPVVRQTQQLLLGLEMQLSPAGRRDRCDAANDIPE